MNDNNTDVVDLSGSGATDSVPESVAGLLLAAGEGSRFDGAEHKLVSTFRGRPLAAWALGAMIEAMGHGALSAVYVVTGAASIRPALEWLIDNTSVDRRPSGSSGAAPEDSHIARVLGITLVVNERWADGQATSLAAGIAQVAADGHEAVVVGLADQPFVGRDDWSAVAQANSPIATAAFGGDRRPPVKLRSDTWPLLPRTGDEGARSVLRLHPELVSEVACIGNPIDIDTMEDLRRWS